MKHVIIGGVAGGATAAAAIRRADESAEIVLLEKGKYISYANCGLPYYIGGVIKDRDNLFVQTPQSFGQRFNVDVRVENEVIGINAETKTVKIRRADGVEYSENFDKLLLSPGANPMRPSLEGINQEGIFTLRDVRDTDNIKNYLNSRKVKEAVVVGGGFIGLEMAENLYHAGANVSIVELADQVMAPIDYSMASQVHQHLLEKGVSLYLQQGVESFSKEGNQIKLHFKTGELLLADLVILSIGVRPSTKLAVDAGLKIGETGGIWVDNFLQTSAKDIYAVGDAIEFPHPLTGKPWLNYLANPANRQGRIVADNMVLGDVTKYEGAIGTSIAKVFDLTVAATGLPAKRLKMMNIPYQSSWTHSNSHAGYYPDALPMSLKLTFDPSSGKIYGAQIVGYDGVDKRIDQIALIIKNGGTIYDLMKLEHAYAPPFSSAKDPVAIAGYVANNIVRGAMPVITWREMENINHNEVLLVDVRTKEEFEMGAMPGAVNIPLDEIRDRLAEIPRDKPIITACAIGLRGYLAARILLGNGYESVRNLAGGYKTYSFATAPVTQKYNAQHALNVELSDSQLPQTAKNILKVDAVGLACPGPIMKVKEAMDSVNEGDIVEIVATDAGFARDARAWCNSTGNQFVSSSEDKGRFSIVIQKGSTDAVGLDKKTTRKGKTFIMFSDELDKALATFVLANGAAATGQKTTIFFTFWGLNVIKKENKPDVEKDVFGKMFGMMLPANSSKLKLSKMNMAGAGRKMMRYIMKEKGIDSLESLRKQAIDNGVEFIACQMSMDVMGVKAEELMDNVTIGGVATYMERADEANVNLFI